MPRRDGWEDMHKDLDRVEHIHREKNDDVKEYQLRFSVVQIGHHRPFLFHPHGRRLLVLLVVPCFGIAATVLMSLPKNERISQ